jgi:hypothetical protein
VIESLGAFETRDFYLACFLRRIRYGLLDLRTEAADGLSCSRIGRRGART